MTQQGLAGSQHFSEVECSLLQHNTKQGQAICLVTRGVSWPGAAVEHRLASTRWKAQSTKYIANKEVLMRTVQKFSKVR